MPTLPPLKHALARVPQITLIFWITKLLTTGVGETTSDYFVHQFDPVIVVALAGIALVTSLALQFWMKRYVAGVYWLAVVLVSVFGTMAADVLHIGLGIPYVASAIFFGLSLTGIFLVWHWSEKSLSIHSIQTTRRELFYWATILTTFALGTAVGDLTAVTLHLGYFMSGIMFMLLILLPLIAWKMGFNAIATFWIAYILTRPVGASFADWMGVSQARGGLNWGTGAVSLGLLALIVLLVGYLSVLNAEDPDRPSDVSLGP